jgi:chorismate lyase/3-hydroxybenzoate synthase
MLSFYAIKSPRPIEVSAMNTPTLNEACVYGADFSRGLRVVDGNKIALYISGTASVDEEGRTAHAGNFAAQVDRMLLNVETLLSAQNAAFRNILSAITYLKSADDSPLLRRILEDRGLGTMPNVVVHAAVCRPDLLCEMEAVAALPKRIIP